MQSNQSLNSKRDFQVHSVYFIIYIQQRAQ